MFCETPHLFWTEDSRTFWTGWVELLKNDYIQQREDTIQYNQKIIASNHSIILKKI